MGRMSLIKPDSAASQAIKSLLAERGSPGPVRIELQFTGCCDPSLGLIVDEAHETDIVEKVDGLTFVIDPQAQELAGDVSIAYKDDGGRDVFVLRSTNPIGEWEGFMTCELRI
jgi:Fe-S cluster assembly iron-binding protein IscA